MTNGSGDDAVVLKEQAAKVLGGLGLRFSEAKTRVTHLSEGIDNHASPPKPARS